MCDVTLTSENVMLFSKLQFCETISSILLLHIVHSCYHWFYNETINLCVSTFN